MARIWFLRQGQNQQGGAKGEKSLDWCVKHLGLRQHHWNEDLQQRPLIIGQPNHLTRFKEYQIVIVTLDEDDVIGKAGWKTGNYWIEKEPAEVANILGIS